MQIRAFGDVSYAQVARIAQTARAVVGDRIVLDLRTTREDEHRPETSVEVWLSPANSRSLKHLVRLIKALGHVGVAKLKIVSDAEVGAIQCDVYTFSEYSDMTLVPPSSAVVWFFAEWSVESMVNDQEILQRPDFWVAMTAEDMPLVIVDCTRSTIDETIKLRATTDGDVLPAVVVNDWRSGTLRRSILTGLIDEKKLFRAIKGCVGPRDGKGQ